MERYKNINGNSGIEKYEIGNNYIRVQFNDESIYLYTYASAGPSNIEQMKKLAIFGGGLNAFINKKVRKSYEKKER